MIGATNVAPAQRARELIGQKVVVIVGDKQAARREQLCRALPIHRVVGPADIAMLAIQLMRNSALTGATFDVGGATNSSRAAPVLPRRLGVRLTTETSQGRNERRRI